jgi:hypothetical protein
VKSTIRNYLKSINKTSDLNNEQKQIEFINKFKIKLFIINSMERNKFIKLMDASKKKTLLCLKSEKYEFYKTIE